MYLADYHVHSTISPDGRCSMTELAEHAVALGLDEICFTDHYDVDYPFTPFILDIENYAREINRLKDKYKDTLEYIEMMDCRFFFNEIPLNFLGL